ncbi:hypothetical protein U1Q18_043888 [Sarracenia purpurea var. burkii]
MQSSRPDRIPAKNPTPDRGSRFCIPYSSASAEDPGIPAVRTDDEDAGATGDLGLGAVKTGGTEVKSLAQGKKDLKRARI